MALHDQLGSETLNAPLLVQTSAAEAFYLKVEILDVDQRWLSFVTEFLQMVAEFGSLY